MTIREKISFFNSDKKYFKNNSFKRIPPLGTVSSHPILKLSRIFLAKWTLQNSRQTLKLLLDNFCQSQYRCPVTKTRAIPKKIHNGKIRRIEYSTVIFRFLVKILVVESESSTMLRAPSRQRKKLTTKTPSKSVSSFHMNDKGYEIRYINGKVNTYLRSNGVHIEVKSRWAKKETHRLVLTRR